MIRYVVFSVVFLALGTLHGQGTVYTPKLGLVLGTQSWNGTQSLPLISYHAGVAFEGYKEDAKNSFYGSLGVHNRGSNERIFVRLGSQTGEVFRQNIQLTNVSLQGGVKNRLSTEGSKLPYYSFGVRLEYTLANNFKSFEQYVGFLPFESFINKYNYGATLAFGYEFPISELVGGVIEASVNPDLSFQYNQAQAVSITSPVNGQAIRVPAQQIRNVTFELTFGLRLTNKVIYID